MFDWSLDLLFSKDLVQFTTFRAPTLSHAEDNHNPGATVVTPVAGNNIGKKAVGMSIGGR